MKRVKRSYCEVPFVVTLENGEHVKGKIDRLCEMDDGSWVVIDYKSEAAAGLMGGAVLAEEYRKAREIYNEAGIQLVKSEKIVGFLYFTEVRLFHKNSPE